MRLPVLNEPEVINQREKRIKLYAIAGFWVFAILAAVSGRTDFLFSVVFVSVLMVGIKAIFTTRFYAMMEAKKRQGKMYYFPVARLLALCAIAVVSGVIACYATYFVGSFS